ncbi:DUF4858 domain-containing protein [Bacteroides sp. 51]|uniref:DUF4858 domain-containing protein n=1 Tax=Bacteroides sp. 51 TaxID=2302938 RepID=UPI0013D703FE|nr:DUF4858 domain-containing protein [Bacteroides sp. 51]NDV81892.1 DUF4858 domain-containing protein [Bacteroides sp. 51]
MSKRLSLFLSVSLISLLAHAQWNQKDSLNLRRILNTDGEIKLNPNIIKEIDFGTFAGEQVISDEKPALQFDATLPKVFPEKKEIRLSLRPYTAKTKYNYDPIYQRKINIKKDTWKYGDQDPRTEAWKYGKFHMNMAFIYSNWAKNPLDPGIRKSVDEIEATGLRYNPLANRANNIAVGGWGPSDGSGLSGDFMAPFTKDFWDKKGRKRRARTLEVLENYGDSISSQIKEEIKGIIH